MAVSFLAILGIAIGLQIVVAVVLALFFILRKNKKSKKKTPKASPSASPDASTPEPDPILIANDDGTYAIVDSVESFSRNRPGYGRRLGRYPFHKPKRDPVYGLGRPMRPRWGRRERFEEPADEWNSYSYVHKTKNVLEPSWDEDQYICESDVDQCRMVKFDNKEDMFWLLSKIYQDVKSISLERLNELITRDNYFHLEFEIVNKDPLTVTLFTPKMEAVDTFVVSEEDLIPSYMGILPTAKLNGRPLPRPVESEDYSINLNE